jgi:S1-C subfamily serine protease
VIFMLRTALPILVLAGLTVAGSGRSTAAEGGRAPANSIERYGLGGFVQPIGLHHGFHIEKVATDSAAERDRLAPHDIIVKVDGEEIRSLEHLRTLLTDIAEDDGIAELTVLKEGSLEHHVIKCHLKGRS